MTVDTGQAGQPPTEMVDEASQPQSVGEINLAALPKVKDLVVASASLTDAGNGVWQVDLIVAGSPNRINRFREGLTRTKAVRLPILGEDCMVKFAFDARDDEEETPLTTATWVIIDAMQASVLPEREATGNPPASTTPAGASSAPGRRAQAGATRPRHRMTAYRS